MKTFIKLIPLIFAVMIISGPATGQEKEVYSEVEQMPEYPGGMEAFQQFMVENVSYPEAAKQDGIGGKVLVQFTVGMQGQVMDARIIKSVHPELDAEALRVVNQMPDWKPGKKDGHAVKVGFIVPVQFKLSPEKESK